MEKNKTRLSKTNFGEKKKDEDRDPFIHYKLCDMCKGSQARFKPKEKKNLFTTSTNVCHLEGQDCYLVMKATETFRKEPKAEVQIKKNELKEDASMTSSKKIKNKVHSNRRHVHNKRHLCLDRNKDAKNHNLEMKKAISKFNWKFSKKREIKLHDIPGWYQELSYHQMGHLQIMAESLRMDREENACIRTTSILHSLGVSPLPSRNLIMKCIKLARDSAIFFLIYFYKFTGYRGCTSIPTEESKFNVNSRICLSGAFYLALERTIRDLESKMPPPLPIKRKPPKIPYKTPINTEKCYVSIYARPLYFPFKLEEEYNMYNNFQYQQWKALQSLEENRKHKLKRLYSCDPKNQSLDLSMSIKTIGTVSSQGMGTKKWKISRALPVRRPDPPTMPGGLTNKSPFGVKKVYSICTDTSEESDQVHNLFDVKEIRRMGIEKHNTVIERESRRYGDVPPSFVGVNYAQKVSCVFWDEYLSLKNKDREELLNLISSKKAYSILSNKRIEDYGADLDLNDKSIELEKTEESLCLDEVESKMEPSVVSVCEEEEYEKKESRHESIFQQDLISAPSNQEYEEDLEMASPNYCTCMTTQNWFNLDGDGFAKCCGRRNLSSSTISNLYPNERLMLREPPIKTDPYYEDSEYRYSMVHSIIDNELMNRIMKNYPSWPPLLKEVSIPFRFRQRVNTSCLGPCSPYFHPYFHRVDEDEDDLIEFDPRLVVDEVNRMPRPIRTFKVFKAHICGYWEDGVQEEEEGVQEEEPTEISENETNPDVVKSEKRHMKPEFNTEDMLLECLSKMVGNPIASFPNIEKIPIIRQWLRMRNHKCISNSKMASLKQLAKSKILDENKDADIIRAKKKLLPIRVCKKLTWNDIKWVKSKALKESMKYQRNFKKTIIDSARVFWSYNLQEYYPHRADFRRVFFSYLPCSEPNILLINPPNIVG